MRPLLLKSLVERTAKIFPKKEVVCREPPRANVGLPIDFRYTYGELYPRLCKLANVLEGLGVNRGDLVGVFAWNSHRSLELYFAVPCIGAVYHGINFLFPKEMVVYSIAQGEDKVLFLDEEYIPQVEDLKDELKTVKAYVIMTDKEKLPKTKLSPAYSYDELMNKASSDYTFPNDLDENSPAALTNTTGTTLGRPKGIIYTHRGLLLHALIGAQPGSWDWREEDVYLSSTDIFYAHGTDTIYGPAMVGAKLVLAGAHWDARTMLDLIQQEKVTNMVMTPVTTTDMARILEREKYDVSSVRRMSCYAVPPAILAIYKELGVPFAIIYGGTEAYPLAWLNTLKSYMKDWPEDKREAQSLRTGLPMPGIEWRVLNLEGKEVKHDGKEIGELSYRGFTLIDEYYKGPEETASSFKGGWFYPGDMVTVDEEGYIDVKDRTVDVIKSGGEIISPRELENILWPHPAVQEVAVIGMPHEELGERPLAFVVLKDEYKGKVSKDDILKSFAGKVSKLAMPADVVFLDALPRTPLTGKWDKRALRKLYAPK